jgi:DNA-binding MarR family transcriptional regulator
MSLPTRQHAVKSPAGVTHTPAGEVLTALVVPVIQLEALFTRAGEAIAEAGGQTLARWLVMETVASTPGSVAHIARALGLTRQSVQRVADLLEKEGLTAYTDNPAHERSKLVRLTAQGRRTLRAIQGAQRVWANRVGGEIGEADLRHASRIVERLTRALKTDRARRGFT